MCSRIAQARPISGVEATRRHMQDIVDTRLKQTIALKVFILMILPMLTAAKLGGFLRPSQVSCRIECNSAFHI